MERSEISNHYSTRTMHFSIIFKNERWKIVIRKEPCGYLVLCITTTIQYKCSYSILHHSNHYIGTYISVLCIGMLLRSKLIDTLRIFTHIISKVLLIKKNRTTMLHHVIPSIATLTLIRCEPREWSSSLLISRTTIGSSTHRSFVLAFFSRITRIPLNIHFDWFWPTTVCLHSHTFYLRQNSITESYYMQTYL